MVSGLYNIVCELLVHKYHSDYGYQRSSDGSGCTKEEGYDVSKHCTVGQKTYLKSSTGRRLIPGDLCINSEAYATFSNATCTGYEYDAGVDYPDNHNNQNSEAQKVGGAEHIFFVYSLEIG